MPKKKEATPAPTPKATKPAPADKPKAATAKAADKPKAAPKAAKPQPAPEKPVAAKQAPETVPGVRAMRTRAYLAGTIIAKHGIAAGVSPAMVDELDEAYGKPNPVESRFRLCEAWHGARGYLGIAEDAIA